MRLTAIRYLPERRVILYHWPKNDQLPSGTAKIIMVSTPTDKGASRIEAAYEESDKRRYFVPCQDCGEHQVLKWSNVKWEEGKPASAEYVCEHCGSCWSDVKRFAAIRYGEWRKTAEGDGKTAGFHLFWLIFTVDSDGRHGSRLLWRPSETQCG